MDPNTMTELLIVKYAIVTGIDDETERKEAFLSTAAEAKDLCFKVDPFTAKTLDTFSEGMYNIIAIPDKMSRLALAKIFVNDMIKILKDLLNNYEDDKD